MASKEYIRKDARSVTAGCLSWTSQNTGQGVVRSQSDVLAIGNIITQPKDYALIQCDR